MRLLTRQLSAIAVLATGLLCAPVLPAHAAPTAKGLPSTNVPWLSVASDAEVDAALQRAQKQNKPLLLYWGASWCPPCNQLKATLFNRQDFANLSRHFVPVHVDGDRAGAQRVSSRFKVSGYPTVVLFTARGEEITRLPGEADAPQVMALLQAGLNGGRPAATVLADALAGKPLSAADWRLLSFYSWETSEERLVPKADTASTLARLATLHAVQPQAEAEADTTTRLWLKALAASDEAPAAKAVKPDAALRQRVQAVLAQPVQARAQMDILTGSAAELVRVLEPEAGPARAALVAAFDTTLVGLAADSSLSRNDRMGALYARVMLARIDLPKDTVNPALPEALRSTVAAAVAREDREIRDGHERQAVITFGAATLARAGLWADSEALLKSNLARSHSPYYLMSQLAAQLRRQGRNDEALRWFEESHSKAVGPATRVQWGAGHVNALVDLAPQDTARIEKAVATLLADAAADSAAFQGRSARSLQRVADKLATWNSDGSRQAVLLRLQRTLNPTCSRTPVADGQRERCTALFKAALAPARAAAAPGKPA